MTGSRKPKLVAITTRLTRKPKSEERQLVKGLPRALPLSRDIKPTISELESTKRKSERF